jgi:hypothetical protein
LALYAEGDFFYYFKKEDKVSVLVLKKGSRTSEGVIPYTVIRQHPKITHSTRNTSTVKLGSFGGYLFRSQAGPDVSEDTIWLRGYDKTADSNKMYVSDEDEDAFEKAIWLFNKRYSNNKDIEPRDVIWKRNDK